VFPRTTVIPLGVRRFEGALLLVGALLLLAGCGAPPQPLPKSPPPAVSSSGPVSPAPSLPLITSTLPPLGSYAPGPGLPSYPVATLRPTTGPTLGTRSPTPTPSHAARCAGPPTGAEIIALLKKESGVPKVPLKVLEGPFCSGDWSFTTVGLSGETAQQDEALMVVTTGRGATLDTVAAGSDVCIDRVVTEAPPGIRVLACGL
jgi:hypothetical protein